MKESDAFCFEICGIITGRAISLGWVSDFCRAPNVFYMFNLRSRSFEQREYFSMRERLNLFALSAFATMPDLRLRKIAIKKAMESYHILKIYLVIFGL